MSKTSIMAELEPFAAIMVDCTAWDSALLEPLFNDLLSLDKLVRNRGLPIIMIDLPDMGKMFTSSLSRGYLRDWTIPHTLRGKTWSRGTFLQCLLEKCFDENGVLRLHIDPNHVFFFHQICNLAKKVRKECSDATILAEVDAFRKIEVETRPPSLAWAADQLFEEDGCGTRLHFLDGYRMHSDWFSDREPCRRSLIEIFQRVCDINTVEFAELDWRCIRPRHGPGAVADAKSGTDKYLFPHWPRKLDQLFPAEHFAQHREDLHLEVARQWNRSEPAARLLAVPKTLKAPRLIASEPVSHQFLQQGLMEWLRENLPKSLSLSINFHNQEPSKKAALAASIDGSAATIDLSSASDRLSCWVVERVFRKNPSILAALHATRTRMIKNCTGVGEDFTIIAKKFAAQGSAVTFPVQSIVYSNAAIASVLYENGVEPTYHTIQRFARQVRVYGDDIVISSQAAQTLAELLTYLGLKVNMGKSHITGHFRESCGMDAYAGNDVSPVYLRDLMLADTTLSLESWVDISNNAYTKGLWSLSDWMINQVPDNIRKLIPITRRELGCATFRTFSTEHYPNRRRYNKNLHRDEILAIQVSARNDRRRRGSYASLLQFFLERGGTFDHFNHTKWSEGYDVRSHLRIRRCWVPTIESGGPVRKRV